MIESPPHRIKRVARIAVAAFFCALCLGQPSPAGAGEPSVLNIGYLELEGDPRYEVRRAYARIALDTRARPFAGAELGVADGAMVASAAETNLVLKRIAGATPYQLVSLVKQAMTEDGIHFFLSDLPLDTVHKVARASKGLDAVFLNVSEGANVLREEGCAANLIHIYPSLRMRTDALAQYLRAKDWGKVLLLVGPGDENAAYAAGFSASAKRYALRIVDERDFELSNDPRQRTKNNVALLTSSTRDYDVVVLADREGEFARYVPFATNRPRPVMGGAGLDAKAWHWTFERFGAPQLNSRFVRATKGRHMSSADWAAWVAVKAIVQARVRGKSPEFDAMSAYMRGNSIRIDGFKGVALSLRPWNNQLRQPILLATHNAVVTLAPIGGFLHQINDLDTLGVDQKENSCAFE